MIAAKKPAAYKYDISWLTLAKAFWNEKKIGAAVALTIACVGAAVVYKLPAVYRAEALVLVDSQKIPERFVSSTVTAEVADRLTTISQEILSSTRLDKVIADFNLYAEQRKTMVQEEIIGLMRRDLDIKVERYGGANRPGAFRISYSGSDPMVVAQVTNRVANLYIEENLRTREVQAEGTSEFIDHQLQEAKKQLDELEASVSRYKLQHSGELPQQEMALTTTLGRLQAEMNSLQESVGRAEQSKILLQNSLASAEASEAALSRALRPAAPRTQAAARQEEDDLPAVAAAPRPPSRAEQAASRLHALRQRYSDEHPEVREAIREVERAKASEAQQQPEPAPERRNGTVRAAAPAPASEAMTAERAALLVQYNQARERTSTVRAQLAALEREIESRQADRRRILRDMGSYQARVEKLPLREQEMAGLTRDYEISRTNYQSLLNKKIAADMAGDLERRQKAERFTILDPARVPEKPAKPNRPVLYIAVLLGSLVLGVGVSIGKGLAHDRLLGEWEMPKDVPILGRVPRIELEATVGAADGGGTPAPVPGRRWKAALLPAALAALSGGAAWTYRLFQG